MSKGGTWLLTVLVGVLAMACGSSGGPAGASAPQASAPGASAALPEPPQALVIACYDCHSDRADAPWNARLAPSYWASGSARKDLDFSEWSAYDGARRTGALLAIAKSVNEGSMPPHDYKLLHPAAKLSAADKAAILAWTAMASPARTP
jgi:cytochrome c553